MSESLQPLENALWVIAKRPQPGMTKTRLSPPLSPEQAACLYHCFLQDTLDLVRRVPFVARGILYLPAQERPYFADLAPDFDLLLQTGASLGARLNNGLSDSFARGFRRVIIMNSDGPTLPPQNLQDAFTALDDADVVLGPSEDGGYYLIGLKRPAPRLLLDVTMSTSAVLTDTLLMARKEGLRVHLTRHWYDVDDFDLPGAPAPRAFRRPTRPGVQYPKVHPRWNECAFNLSRHPCKDPLSIHWRGGASHG